LVLLAEQVRLIKNEEQLLNDTTDYPQTTATDWVTKITKNITLASEKLLYAEVKMVVGYGAYAWGGAARILLDGNPIVATGYMFGSGALTITRGIYLILPAGSYSFEWQLSCFKTNTTGDVHIDSALLSILDFVDKDKQNYDSGSTSCPATSTTTLINQNFTIPAIRKLAVGSIKKYVAYITVLCHRDNQRVSKMKNSGESDDANFFNWKILIDDVQQSWSERNDDCGSETGNIIYAEGAFGKLTAVLDPSTQYNLKINCYNGFSNAYNGRAVVKIVICPWIIPKNQYEPINLDFPQGSTLYVLTEPLDLDPTKDTKIGRQRMKSFGSSTDYYSTASGTGILSHNYTFEVIKVVNSVLLVNGHGGCISALGVDIR